MQSVSVWPVFHPLSFQTLHVCVSSDLAGMCETKHDQSTLCDDVISNVISLQSTFMAPGYLMAAFHSALWPNERFKDFNLVNQHKNVSWWVTKMS